MRHMITGQPLKTLIVLIIVTVLGMSAGLWLTHASKTAQAGPKSQAKVLETPQPLTGFELGTGKPNPLNLDTLKGKWTLLFFGYTHCPDVCPVTLAELGRMFRQIRTQPELANTQAVFVSVDPARDTPESLPAYVEYFDPGFIGATGSTAELNRLTEQLKVRYSRGQDTNNGYTVNHTSAIFLIDPQARYYAYLLPPHYAEDMYYHYTAIRSYYEGK